GNVTIDDILVWGNGVEVAEDAAVSNAGVPLLGVTTGSLALAVGSAGTSTWSASILTVGVGAAGADTVGDETTGITTACCRLGLVASAASAVLRISPRLVIFLTSLFT